jgi:hypothetical protein
MEESVQSEKTELRTLVLECTSKILDSLLILTGSPGPGHISDDFVEKINLLYSDLESCDYIGINTIFELSTIFGRMHL